MRRKSRVRMHFERESQKELLSIEGLLLRGRWFGDFRLGTAVLLRATGGHLELEDQVVIPRRNVAFYEPIR